MNATVVPLSTGTLTIEKHETDGHMVVTLDGTTTVTPEDLETIREAVTAAEKA